MRRLTERGLLVRLRLSAFRGSGQYVYFLSRSGSPLLFGPTVSPPRGEPGRDLYHSLGLSTFYLTLQTALKGIHGELVSWWGQAAAACPLDAGHAPYINPDAAFLIAHRWEQLCLLEYDRSPNAAGASQFLSKITRYLRYYEQRTYCTHLGQGSLKPLLLCLFEDQARMERVLERSRVILERLRSNQPTLLFGSQPAIRHPLGPVWHDLADAQPLSLLHPSLC